MIFQKRFDSWDAKSAANGRAQPGLESAPPSRGSGGVPASASLNGRLLVRAPGIPGPLVLILSDLQPLRHCGPAPLLRAA